MTNRAPCLVIVGQHCAGKTTLVKRVAEKLNWRAEKELGDVMRQDTSWDATLRAGPNYDATVLDQEVWRDCMAGGCARVIESWHSANWAWCQFRSVHSGSAPIYGEQTYREAAQRGEPTLHIELQVCEKTIRLRKELKTIRGDNLPTASSKSQDEMYKACSGIHRETVACINRWGLRCVSVANDTEDVDAVVDDIVDKVLWWMWSPVGCGVFPSRADCLSTLALGCHVLPDLDKDGRVSAFMQEVLDIDLVCTSTAWEAKQTIVFEALDGVGKTTASTTLCKKSGAVRLRLFDEPELAELRQRFDALKNDSWHANRLWPVNRAFYALSNYLFAQRVAQHSSHQIVLDRYAMTTIAYSLGFDANGRACPQSSSMYKSNPICSGTLWPKDLPHASITLLLTLDNSIREERIQGRHDDESTCFEKALGQDSAVGDLINAWFVKVAAELDNVVEVSAAGTKDEVSELCYNAVVENSAHPVGWHKAVGSKGLHGYNEHIEDVAASCGYDVGPCHPAFLDFAGAAPLSRGHSMRAGHLLHALPPGNPHSSKEVRDRNAEVWSNVLSYFRAPANEYFIVPTSNATTAIRLVNDFFPFQSTSVLAYGLDSHTSVLGLRQRARSMGAKVGWYEMEQLGSLSESLGVLQPVEGSVLADTGRIGPNLLAVTAESNFSGVRAELDKLLLQKLQDGPYKWRVLVDAAKFAATGVLDLSKMPADFVAVSFYKMFGRPTGLGALLIRRDSVLVSPTAHDYFGGGMVSALAATSEFAILTKELQARMSYGTPHFQGIAELPAGFEELRRIHASKEEASHHAMVVACEAARRMQQLSHCSGESVCRLYGNWSVVSKTFANQGPTIAFNVADRCGHIYPFLFVEDKAKKSAIALRVGSLCNAGACQKYLGLTSSDIVVNYEMGHRCDQPIDVVNGRPTGAIRVSFGATSSLRDVDRLVDFLETFLDTLVVDETCDFCSEFVSHKQQEFMQMLPGYKTRNLYFPGQPSLLAVCPTLGCYQVGFLLVIPRQHVLSFAGLHASDLDDAEAFLETLRSIITKAFGPAIIAEHGSTALTSSSQASCVDHAHLHIVPLQHIDSIKQVKDKYEVVGGRGTEYTRLRELANHEGNPYLLLSLKSGSWVVWDRELEKFPRQFFRQVVAEVLGFQKGDYNWRIDSNKYYGNMMKSLELFKTLGATSAPDVP